MPGQNGTGPCGLGPLTGRGMGSCAEAVATGAYDRPFGAGCGMGWGRGRGHRRKFFATGVPGWIRGSAAVRRSRDEERTALAAQAERLEKILESMKKRLVEIDAPTVE